MSKFDQRVVQLACDSLIYKYLVENGHLKTAELLKKKRKRKYNLNVKKDERISEKFSFMITKYVQLKSSSTGKSLSEALIFASTNPQYDDRFPSSNLGRTCCVQKLFLTFRTIFVHNMFSPCCEKRRASDKDLPVKAQLKPLK